MQASNVLENIVLKLKTLYCRTNRSDIVSEVLKIFDEKYFDREIKTLEKKFFDEKAAIKEMLKSKESLDLEKTLRKIIKMKSKESSP